MKLLYLAYLLKNTSRSRFHYLLGSASEQNHKSKGTILMDMAGSFWKWNTSFLDYFYFNFPSLNDQERASYLDTWSMYTFQKKFNKPSHTHLFSDKANFYQTFKDYVSHSHFLPDTKNAEAFESWLKSLNAPWVIAKNSKGQAGSSIEKLPLDRNDTGVLLNGMDIQKSISWLQERNLNLIEQLIEQHEDIKEIYSESLNTVRVITFVEKTGNVRFLGSILRVGTNKSVDNFDAGGVSVLLDQETGILVGPPTYKDPNTKVTDHLHPVTGKPLTGWTLPFWPEVIDLVKTAALLVPEVRTVGWDVAITPNGPSLLEGNHNWDKIHWQKCMGRGLKDVLEGLE